MERVFGRIDWIWDLGLLFRICYFTVVPASMYDNSWVHTPQINTVQDRWHFGTRIWHILHRQRKDGTPAGTSRLYYNGGCPGTSPSHWGQGCPSGEGRFRDDIPMQSFSQPPGQHYFYFALVTPIPNHPWVRSLVSPPKCKAPLQHKAPPEGAIQGDVQILGWVSQFSQE